MIFNEDYGILCTAIGAMKQNVQCFVILDQHWVNLCYFHTESHKMQVRWEERDETISANITTISIYNTIVEGEWNERK